MIRRNFWQSLKKFCTWGSEPPHIFENLKFELQDPKARGHTVAMVTFNVKKMMTTCSPMIAWSVF